MWSGHFKSLFKLGLMKSGWPRSQASAQAALVSAQFAYFFLNASKMVALKNVPLAMVAVKTVHAVKSLAQAHIDFWRRWRTELQDSANPSIVTKALGLMVISPSHGILPSSHPHGVGLWEGKCLQTWKLLKDGWMNGIQGCLEKQPGHHESQSEDKTTWSAKRGI